MPKFGSHMIFAEMAKSKRSDLFPERNINALRLGSIGPDTTLFMFDPATSNPDIRHGFHATMRILNGIQRVKDVIKDIEQAINGPVGDLQDWITGGLSRDLRYTINASIEMMELALKLGISFGSSSINVKNPLLGQLGKLPDGYLNDPTKLAAFWNVSVIDNFGFPFRMFGHPYTADGAWKTPEAPGDYKNWWWMDMLHYRLTGTFAKQLRVNARSVTQKAYATGYMTHVAGDICGHPFINALVQGPFRNHAYRHLVVETLADTWLWSKVGRGDVLGARFDDLIALPGSKDEEIAALVVRTMKDVYTAPMVPSLLRGGYPEEGEWLAGLDLMRQYLRLSTSESTRRPEAPADTPEEIIKELRDLLQNNVPGPFPSPGSDPASFLKALFSWFSKGLVLLAMIATLPVAVLARIITIAPRWAIYLFNLALFLILSSIRTMLCLTGWGYCSEQDFTSFGFLDGFITTPNFNGKNYPYKTLPNPKLPFYWLQRPEWLADLEGPLTVPMSPPLAGFKPNIMIDPANVMDQNYVLRMIDAQHPGMTREYEFGAGNRQIFGNAVDFSIALLDGTLPVPDFDLDGDRGFGFKGWEELPPNERYI
jgi:hypothetical protein